MRINEKDIIKIFQNNFKNKNWVPEDVEYFKIDKNIVVIKSDSLVESTDVPTNTKLRYIIRKSFISCISDFSSKCVNPKYGIISITIPRNFSKKKITQLARAISYTATEFEIKMLGGDTNEGKELVVNVCLVGITKNIVRRKGAKIDDVIITTGAFGYTSSALNIILKNLTCSKYFEKKAKNFLLKPSSRLNFCISSSKYFSSAMDSSDGLSTTLNVMAIQSKKKFVITKLPTNNDIINFAEINKIDPLKLILDGGEEYEIIATAKPSNIDKIKKNAITYNIELFEIGYVTKGQGVAYRNNNNETIIKDHGWIHLN